MKINSDKNYTFQIIGTNEAIILTIFKYIVRRACDIQKKGQDFLIF